MAEEEMVEQVEDTAPATETKQEKKPRAKKIKKAEPQEEKTEQVSMQEALRRHPLFGKKILICPKMTPDAKRNLSYEEEIGHDIQVREVNAGERIKGSSDEMDRMVGDYEVVHEDKSRPIYAMTTFPKIGTEISYTLGKDLVPVVEGNDGKRGYIWSFPERNLCVGDTIIHVMGLKNMIEIIAPELLPKFRNKPMMDYIDGVTLAASIPLTTSTLKEWRMQELKNVRAGII